ncbi:hypothetical protein LCGC14_2637280 [marine sediment metagenome]|uniref:Uncharacterized protein n=1 Tax=marine sediment metagenome TaxID=412755 RepID=A0A0F9AL24_9ZZZZ
MTQNIAKMVSIVPLGKENFEDFLEDMQNYQVRVIIKAVRMEGIFSVETQSGEIITCRDGYLAVDAEGYPYPIDAETTEIHILGDGTCCELFCNSDATIEICYGPTPDDITYSCPEHIYALMSDAPEHTIRFL